MSNIVEIEGYFVNDTTLIKGDIFRDTNRLYVNQTIYQTEEEAQDYIKVLDKHNMSREFKVYKVKYTFEFTEPEKVISEAKDLSNTAYVIKEAGNYFQSKTSNNWWYITNNINYAHLFSLEEASNIIRSSKNTSLTIVAVNVENRYA